MTIRWWPFQRKAKQVEQRFGVLICFRLSNRGQHDAIRRRLNAARDQSMSGLINANDVRYFSVDREGYLVGSTVTGSLYGYRPAPRLIGLAEDVALDICPASPQDVIDLLRPYLSTGTSDPSPTDTPADRVNRPQESVIEVAARHNAALIATAVSNRMNHVDGLTGEGP